MSCPNCGYNVTTVPHAAWCGKESLCTCEHRQGGHHRSQACTVRGCSCKHYVAKPYDSAERYFLDALQMSRAQLESFIDRVYRLGGADRYVDVRWRARSAGNVLAKLAAHGIVQHKGMRVPAHHQNYWRKGAKKSTTWIVRLTPFALDWVPWCKLDWQLRNAGVPDAAE